MIGLFSPYGVVTYVRLLRDKVTKELTGSAMVEFKTEEGKAKYVPWTPSKSDHEGAMLGTERQRDRAVCGTGSSHYEGVMLGREKQGG